MKNRQRSRLAALLDRVGAWPAWSRPPLFGAAILFAVVAVRMVVALPVIILGGPGSLGPAMLALLGATCAGAAGGFAYSFVGRPALRIPVVGRYLTGIVCVAAYLTPLLVWGDRLLGGEKLLDFHDTIDVVVWLGCVLLFGVVMGQTWFDPPPPPARRRRDRAA